MYFESMDGDIELQKNKVVFKQVRIDSPLAIIRINGEIDTRTKNY